MQGWIFGLPCSLPRSSRSTCHPSGSPCRHLVHQGARFESRPGQLFNFRCDPATGRTRNGRSGIIRARSIRVLIVGLLASGGDAPDGISDVIGNQKRTGLVDGEFYRPSPGLSVGVKEIGDHILRFAIGTAGAEGHETTL